MIFPVQYIFIILFSLAPLLPDPRNLPTVQLHSPSLTFSQQNKAKNQNRPDRLGKNPFGFTVSPS